MAYIDNGITGLALRGKLNNQLTNYINVKDYGAAGNGVTDDSAAFQSAVDAMALNGGIVIVPDGTYIINSQIVKSSFTRNRDCIIIGMGSVYIDFSGNALDIEAFELECTPDAEYTAIDANISKGDQTITTALTAEKGDVLEIYSTDLWGRTALVVRRELVKVKSVAAGVITLYTPIYDDYNSTTTTIGNQNMGRCVIKNIKLKGNSAKFQNAFTLRGFRNIDISDNEITDFENSGMALSKCYGGHISNNDIYDTLRDGFGYGVSLDVCQNILIDNNNINGARHAVKMGLTTRSCIVRANHVYAGLDYYYPMDNHESCEQITFDGNFLYGGGFYLRGLNNIITNNTIYRSKAMSAGIGVTLYGYTDRPNEYLIISGNKIIDLGGINEYGIQIKFWYNDDVIERVLITNNQFVTDNFVIYVHLDAGTETGNRMGLMVVDGNMFETIATKAVMYLNEPIQYDNIVIKNNHFKGGGGVSLAGVAGSGQCYIDNNIIDVNDSPVSCPSGNFDNLYVKNNHLKGTEYLNLKCDDTVILQNNIIEGLIKGGIKIITGVQRFVNDGNININVTGTIEDDAVATETGVNF